MTDFTASQAQSSAERACPLRQTILVDADQRRRIVGHHGHPHVYDGAAMTFIGDASGSTAQQAGHDAFNHGSAVATRVGEVHLTRGPYSRQASFAQEPQTLSGVGDEGRGATVFGIPTVRIPRWCNASRREASLHATSPASEWRVGLGRCDPTDRLLHVVDQGLHVAGVTGVSHGHMQAKDEARRWLGNHSGLATKLGGAVALPFAHGRNGRIVGVDNFAVGQRLALREPAGLVCNPVMRLERGGDLGIQACPLLLRQGRCPMQTLLGGPCQGQDLLSQCQPWRLRLAHQRHTHVSHPPALAAEAAHQFLEVVLECLRVLAAPPWPGWCTAQLWTR